jgi:ankyrin repeat protein
MSDTLLHFFCKLGRRAEARTAVRSGHDLNAEDSNGMTPLQLTCKYGGEALGLELLDLGASLAVRDSAYGRTMLHWACVYDRPVLAVAFAKRGCHVNATDKEGCTPLHLVHSEAVAKELLALGADIHAQDEKGETPFDAAISRDNIPLARFLSIRSCETSDDGSFAGPSEIEEDDAEEMSRARAGTEPAMSLHALHALQEDDAFANPSFFDEELASECLACVGRRVIGHIFCAKCLAEKDAGDCDAWN